MVRASLGEEANDTDVQVGLLQAEVASKRIRETSGAGQRHEVRQPSIL